MHFKCLNLFFKCLDLFVGWLDLYSVLYTCRVSVYLQNCISICSARDIIFFVVLGAYGQPHESDIEVMLNRIGWCSRTIDHENTWAGRRWTRAWRWTWAWWGPGPGGGPGSGGGPRDPGPVVDPGPSVDPGLVDPG